MGSNWPTWVTGSPRTNCPSPGNGKLWLVSPGPASGARRWNYPQRSTWVKNAQRMVFQGKLGYYYQRKENGCWTGELFADLLVVISKTQPPCWHIQNTSAKSFSDGGSPSRPRFCSTLPQVQAKDVHDEGWLGSSPTAKPRRQAAATFRPLAALHGSIRARCSPSEGKD